MNPFQRTLLPALLAAALLYYAPMSAAADGGATPEVTRLQALLRGFYASLEMYLANRLEPGEVLARQQAQHLAEQTYDGSKVRLSGAEGSLLLAEYTRRLYDPDIPRVLPAAAPVCSLHTYLLGNLIAGERRDFEPVGKHHYLLKEQLQPGETTIEVSGHSWVIHIPEESYSQAYLLALYSPPGEEPSFHAFPVNELLATHEAHIPPWLPDEFKLRRRG